MFDEMNPGQIVDFCIDYNNYYDNINEDKADIYEARQIDFDKF